MKTKGFFTIDLNNGQRVTFSTNNRDEFEKHAFRAGKKVKSIGWSDGYNGYGDPVGSFKLKEIIYKAKDFAERFYPKK